MMVTKIRGDGVTTRVRQIGSRAVVEGISRQSFDHAWRCLDAQGGLEVQLGLVNGMEPFIDGRPMSGYSKDGAPDKRGVPVLALPNRARFPYWICIRIEVSDAGVLRPEDLSPATLAVIVSPVRISTDRRIGLHAIAMMRELDGVADLHQIGRFDYQHYVTGKAADRRHHFAIA